MAAAAKSVAPCCEAGPLANCPSAVKWTLPRTSTRPLRSIVACWIAATDRLSAELLPTSINFKLRMAIDKAREAAMPNENIDRAIKKGTGMGREAIEEVTYEGYGPAGSAFIVEAVTDNSNRTLQSIRNIFTKNGGHIGGQGSVAWMFGSDMKPQQNIEPSKEDLVKIQDLVDKLTEEEDVVNVHTNL